jgi:hypothetical protein
VDLSGFAVLSLDFFFEAGEREKMPFHFSLDSRKSTLDRFLTPVLGLKIDFHACTAFDSSSAQFESRWPLMKLSATLCKRA